MYRLIGISLIVTMELLGPAHSAVTTEFPVTTIVNTNTPFPAANQADFFDLFRDGGILLDDGSMVFQGTGQASDETGIYLSNGRWFQTVADQQTAIPNGTLNFDRFGFDIIGNDRGFTFEGGAGVDTSTDPEAGIYTFMGGVLLPIIDFTTPRPDGNGIFTGGQFYPIYTDGENTVFGFVTEPGTERKVALYLSRGNIISPIVDGDTLAPGQARPFIAFFDARVEGDDIVFSAAYERTCAPVGGGCAFTGWGIYKLGNGVLTVLIDSDIPIPGSVGEFQCCFDFEYHAGILTFLGVVNVPGTVSFSGIFTFDGNSIQTLVDTNTAVPGGSGNFSDVSCFGGLPGASPDFLLEGEDLVFTGCDELDRIGIYKHDGNRLTVVADTNTVIPEGLGSFADLKAGTFRDGLIVFEGADEEGGVGIYTDFGGSIRKIIDSTAILGGLTDFDNFIVYNPNAQRSVAFGAAFVGIHVNGLYRADLGARVLAATLPQGRATVVGNTVTAFATILNTGSSTGIDCGLTAPENFSGAFLFAQTNPISNEVVGGLNEPADIPPDAAQSFVFALTPDAAFASTAFSLGFSCANSDKAPTVAGVNQFILSSETVPVPDILPTVVTFSGDGIMNISGETSSGAVALAAVNLGDDQPITVSADTGGVLLPLTLSLCETNSQTGACLQPPGNTLVTNIGTQSSGSVSTFSVFATSAGVVDFVPDLHRLNVRFTGPDGILRGITSVAVTTAP